MICLLQFRLPTNFTKTITNHYELKTDWDKIQYTTTFLVGLHFFSRTLHAIVTGPFKPESVIQGLEMWFVVYAHVITAGLKTLINNILFPVSPDHTLVSFVI